MQKRSLVGAILATLSSALTIPKAMPENQVSEKTIRHRLATWYARQLPDGHPLLG